MTELLNRVTLLGVLVLALAFGVAGCDKKPDSTAGTGTAAHDGDGGDHDHEHGEGDNDGDHDHGDADNDSAHADDAEDEHDHGDGDHAESDRDLGTIDVGGATFRVVAGGEFAPNADLHLELLHVDGPMPAAVRLWVGDMSGTGSMKVKADGHDDHFHAHVEVPAEITADTELWVEVETALGAKDTTSTPVD